MSNVDIEFDLALFMHESPVAAMAISDTEKEFFVALGERITQLRRVRGITQVQFGEVLGLS